ncbi:MAG: DUF1045 domain-containing protein [Alphaproteobacteria bacterium]
MPPRYAVYYAPEPDSPLGRFGDAWLGRSAQSGQQIDRAGPEGAAAGAAPGLEPGELDRMTAEPRRYGFHGTLKPPFALAAGREPAGLRAAAEAFSGARRPFLLPPLKLARLGRFLALVPSHESAEMADLAAAAVRELDAFRAPASPEELARRRRAGLTPRQEELLLRWGYPHVMKAFRFHLTLSGPLAPADLNRLEAALAPRVAPLCAEPVPVACVWLFEEPDAGLPFRRSARLPFRME